MTNPAERGTGEPAGPSLAAMRAEYQAHGLARDELAPDWLTQFGRWLADAVAAGVGEPNAMVLATATPDGRPSVRTVLLKGYDERGLVFFTNYDSRKAVELASNPAASLVFPWHHLSRQVVVSGIAVRVDRAETEAYFRTRPRGAQLGAWASPQSQVVASREVLDAAWQEYAARWPEGVEVPAPPHWGGYCVVPQTVEFWQGRTDRMHDRLRYVRNGNIDTVEEARLSLRNQHPAFFVERLAP